MDLPYHVSNKEASRLRLWRVEDSKFRIVEYDNTIPILTNVDYTLIENQLSKPFEYLLKDQIEIIPALIERKATNEKWDNYVELKIKNHISPENVNYVDTYGINVWQYSHELFVSPELKKELELIANGRLTFSEGFSLFA